MKKNNNHIGRLVQSGDKFGFVGYWVNRNQGHPIRILYIHDPELLVPRITENLIFIYFGKTKPTPLDISTLIAESYHIPKFSGEF